MPWSGECPACGTWRSTLQPGIEARDLHESIDTDARIAGFKELRVQNNARILDEVAATLPLAGARALDVGSAHGWFLEEAVRRGVKIEGVEPEEALAEQARARGLTVRTGYFPAVLAPDEQVDLISFNDVLEHIPDVDETLAACAGALRPGGVLSINIPSATGLGYRIATGLARIGVRGPYLRLWQFGLPSPHIHYFTPAALERIVARHGFRIDRRLPLSSIRRDGLWNRVHTVSRPTPLSIVSFVALWLAAPILNRPANSDIVLVLARREDGSPGR
jgi:2-polyprenyl-3-methyl-5-hydroxy-6-metoxy-1,4-benzoquinol methylase